jgi:hypothetical protein
MIAVEVDGHVWAWGGSVVDGLTLSDDLCRTLGPEMVQVIGHALGGVSGIGGVVNKVQEMAAAIKQRDKAAAVQAADLPMDQGPEAVARALGGLLAAVADVDPVEVAGKVLAALSSREMTAWKVRLLSLCSRDGVAFADLRGVGAMEIQRAAWEVGRAAAVFPWPAGGGGSDPAAPAGSPDPT